MKIIHRYNSKERHHFLPEKHYTMKLQPRLLYVALLDKQPHWREEPHTHAFAELIFVKDGRGTVTVEGETRPIRRGDLVVYNAGFSHFEVGSGDDPLELCGVAFDKLEITGLPKNWMIPPGYGFVFHAEDLYPLFCERFNALLREFDRREHLYTEIVQHEGRVLLMYLYRLIENQWHPATHPVIRQVKERIDRDFRRPLSLDDLAQTCHTNKYYLAHLFSEVEGMSIGKYILSCRLGEACRLLKETDLPVNSIAERSGFGDASYFCRVFRRERGFSPLAYRRNNQEPPR